MISFLEYTNVMKTIEESTEFYMKDSQWFTGYPVYYGVEDGKKVMIWRKPSSANGKPWIMFGTIVKKESTAFLDLLGEGKHLVPLRNTDLWNEELVDKYKKFIDKLFEIDEFKETDEGKESGGSIPFWGNAIIKTKHGYLIGDIGRKYREEFDYIRVADNFTIHSDSIDFPIEGMSSFLFREYMGSHISIYKSPENKNQPGNYIICNDAYTEWNVSLEQSLEDEKKYLENKEKEEK